MSKFPSCADDDNWRSRQALKRQGAKDLEKLEAEGPVYAAASRRAGSGFPGYLVLAVVGIVSVLTATVSGGEFLRMIVASLPRLLRLNEQSVPSGGPSVVRR